ncbi:Homeodomain-like protein [Dunaliella salina]|uniref:Homeodomain-like protein n=1 Tax=Dunaliella salina TaxID=3046 RepID=A0ABQ7GSE5_DUNSA|nr:Homeodomain-like protein [Dunaliella salina]|eukprot:KAF5837495.1 Homeodomain-like protein [Dunaliella salina]
MKHKNTVWSPEDSKKLEALVARKGRNWQAISLEFHGKYDRHQIRDRWHGQAEMQMFRHLGYWKEDEKERLLEGVELHGLDKWSEVASYVGTRTAKQCRERWQNVISKEVNRGRFTPAEVEALKNAAKTVMQEEGRLVWGKMAKLMPRRTDDQIRRAWQQLQTHGKLHHLVHPLHCHLHHCSSPAPLLLTSTTAPHHHFSPAPLLLTTCSTATCTTCASAPPVSLAPACASYALLLFCQKSHTLQ